MEQLLIHNREQAAWLHFTRPGTVLRATRPSDVLPLLEEVERLVSREGRHAAGWIGYEASPAFDPALCTRPASAFPLVCFGIFDPPATLTGLPVPERPPAVLSWHPSVGRDEYAAAIAQIKEHIASGDTYQVNFTFRQWCRFAVDPWEFFLQTCAGAPYGAFADAGPFAICSASPELFFSLDRERIFSRPMKGTASRGRTTAEDFEKGRWLHLSEKNRSENVMIVDMIRNDLGRIARFGTVRVPRLFEIEPYPTLLQMTSTVEARTSAPLPEILKALFPCASITGAPKAKTMEIIAGLESSPRNIYTGAIGFYGPGRRAMFNVAIRTTLIDRAAVRAEYGVGGGIVWDSTTDEEYRECLTKARVILDPAAAAPFELLETLRWTPGDGYFLLSRHLERLRDSARYFGYRYDEPAVLGRLDEAVRPFPGEECRVRLLLSADGAVRCEAAPLAPSPDRPLLVRIAAAPVSSADPLLFHKTSRRERYDEARAAFPEADDVLLHNEKGELTESTIANVAVLIDGRWLTPPVDCGLLGGTFRALLLARGEIAEGRVTLAQLRQAKRIALINSVRLWREACLDAQDRG